MKNIWILTKTNIKRNQFAVLLAVAGAVLLCMMLKMIGGMIANNTTADISIGMIDYDNSSLSKDFKNYLSEDLHYQLVENSTFQQLSEELIDKKLSVIIEIPEGFYEEYASGNYRNVILTSVDDYENSEYIKVYINNYLNSMSTLAMAAEGKKEVFHQLLTDFNQKKIEISQTAAVTVDKDIFADQSGFIDSIGFFLMFIFAITILIAYMVLEDRLGGVYQRIQITPVKPVQYIIGNGILGLFLSMILVGIYCGYIYVMDINIGIPLPLLLLLMGLFSVFTVCFSLAIAVVLISKNAMTSIIIGFSTVGCILGGAYFPIDLAPKSMQNLARVLPQFWFMDALRSLQLDRNANIYPNVAIILLFAVLSLLIGAVSFAQNYKTNN